MAERKEKDTNKKIVNEEQSAEVVTIKHGRGGKENFPTTISSSTKAEDVKQIGTQLLKWYNLPRAETDQEIAERLSLFFTTCIENGELMTWEKLCLALGYSRKTVWEWETGKSHTQARTDIIKKAKEFLASFDAEMAAKGKINPVVYIFRAKNYFGMTDKQEMVVTPNNPLGELADPEDIKRRYITASDDLDNDEDVEY